MSFAVYNRETNRFSTIVTEATGELSAGYAFVPAADLPVDAVRDEVSPVRVFAAKEFLDRFTVAELVAISEAARTDALLDVMFRKLTAADAVHTDSAELAHGMAYLAARGLVSAERLSAIVGSN